MRLCTIKRDGYEEAAIGLSNGVLPVSQINKIVGDSFPVKLENLIDVNLLKKLEVVIKNNDFEPTILNSAIKYAPLVRNPPQVWGIGLNYKKSLDYVNFEMPPEPNLFMKPNTTIIGDGDNIVLPTQSKIVIAEGELGVIIGKECKYLKESEVQDVILGYTTLFDTVANDILAVNPRFRERSKSFDTFLTLGPWLVTQDEVGNLDGLNIKSILNGKEETSDVVDNMTYSPFYVISFLSKFLTLKPGDIICMGTPKPVEIKHGDKVECIIDKVGKLSNYVVSSDQEVR